MIEQTKKLLNNNKIFLASFIFVVFQVGAYLFPTSYWYSEARIRVQDTHVGQPIKMAIDRKINRPFIGRWSVIVRRINGGQSEVVCTGAGISNYSPTSELPETLTLAWWTNRGCTELDIGFYRVTTIIDIDVISILQPKIVVIESNIFEIKQ